MAMCWALDRFRIESNAVVADGEPYHTITEFSCDPYVACMPVANCVYDEFAYDAQRDMRRAVGKTMKQKPMGTPQKPLKYCVFKGLSPFLRYPA